MQIATAKATANRPKTGLMAAATHSRKSASSKMVKERWCGGRCDRKAAAPANENAMIGPRWRWLTPLLVLLTLASAARADEETGADTTNFVFPSFIAILFTIVVLFILCKPNRKR